MEIIKALTKCALHYRIELTEIELEIYLEELPHRVESHRIVSGINSCLRELAFMPKVAEIISRIPESSGRRSTSNPNCEKCQGTGWELIVIDGNTKARKCGCRTD